MDWKELPSAAQREWTAQKWRCAAVSCAVALWLSVVFSRSNLPFRVRWGAAPLFALALPVFIAQTIPKWRMYRTESR